MSGDHQRAYSTRQWFWAVNLSAALGAVGSLLPAAAKAPLQATMLFPYALVVALIIAWVFVAPALAYAMRKPASWLRTATLGGGTAASIALVGFAIATGRRLRAQADPSYYYQLGGGEYVRDVDGILTPYGWWVIIQNNLLFVALGVLVALIVRSVIGPGKMPL